MACAKRKVGRPRKGLSPKRKAQLKKQGYISGKTKTGHKFFYKPSGKKVLK